MTIDIVEKYVDRIVFEKSQIREINRSLGDGSLVGNCYLWESQLAIKTHGSIKVDGIASEVISVWVFNPRIAVTVKLLECAEFNEFEDRCLGQLYSNCNAAEGLHEKLFRFTPHGSFIAAVRDAQAEAF